MRFKAKLKAITWFLFGITPIIMFLFTEKTLDEFSFWFFEGWDIPQFLLNIQSILLYNEVPIPSPIIYFAWIMICIELTIVLVEVITFLPNLVTKLMHRWVKDE